MTNPKIVGMMLIVAAAASIGLATTGFQSTMASSSISGDTIYADLEEAVEAGNATMMTNQTAANGNMTGTGTNSTS
jgi:hypothetical protein